MSPYPAQTLILNDDGLDGLSQFCFDLQDEPIVNFNRVISQLTRQLDHLDMSKQVRVKQKASDIIKDENDDADCYYFLGVAPKKQKVR